MTKTIFVLEASWEHWRPLFWGVPKPWWVRQSNVKVCRSKRCTAVLKLHGISSVVKVAVCCRRLRTRRQERDAVGVEEVGNGEGDTPPHPTRGSGERRELPQQGPGQSPRQKMNLVHFICHRTLPVEGKTICFSITILAQINKYDYIWISWNPQMKHHNIF